MGATNIAKDWRDDKRDFKYFAGFGIDIGAGGDPILPKVRQWEFNPDGDARYMKGVPDNEYDFVYSSHCLEHLTNVEESLTNWVRILKPGGYLFVIVPDWYLYEHCIWPASFNLDHKFTFSLDIQLERPDHYHVPTMIVPLLKKLKINLIETRLEDWNVNYELIKTMPRFDQSCAAMTQIAIIGQKKKK